jgi:hypothetical protein
MKDWLMEAPWWKSSGDQAWWENMARPETGILAVRTVPLFDSVMKSVFPSGPP